MSVWFHVLSLCPSGPGMLQPAGGFHVEGMVPELNVPALSHAHRLPFLHLVLQSTQRAQRVCLPLSSGEYLQNCRKA